MSNLDRRKRRSAVRLSTSLGFCFSLAAQSSISEAQSPAELRLHVEPGWNALPVIETPRDSDTPLRSSMSIQDSRQRELSIPDIKSTLFSQTSEPQLMVGDGAFENQTVHWVFASQAQDLTLPIPQETVEKNAEQTRTSSSTVAEGWHAVHFIKTHIYDDPQVDRVLRWDPSAKAYKDLSVGDRLEPTVMYWLYRSAPGMLSFSVLGGTARTPQPLTTASEVESQKTPRSLVESAPVIGLGDFETPSVATKNDVHAAMPKSVITGHGEKTMVHLAYIAKDEQGDHIEVLHSLKSGKAGSFRRDQGRRVATALPGWTITELAVAASSEKLVIAWIEKGREGDMTLMRIQKKQLMFTGAQEPTPSIVQAPPGVGEADPSWKRTLSLAIDPDGHVHMTWNQANQVLYAYDFEIERTPDGRPLNVFNQHVRTPATEIVKYKAQYAPRANGRCDCEDCWCDESYPISEEPDPKKDGQPMGPYIDRTHEAYAYAPSLHIGPKSVMIIAKQLRLWEDHPVPSEAWQRMHAEPIYSTTIVQRAQPTKWVQGWRQTWKAAYEPGDEHRWAGLGFQYQYLYQGTWHEDDQIVFAHRSLDREDTKSPAKKEHSAHHPVAPWNLSVVDGHFAPQVSQKPSYPKVAHMPSGSLIAVYEKGPQHDANQADGNPLFYATSDDGQVWASPKNLLAEGQPLAGYLPQVAISGRGEIGVAYYRPSLSTDLGISGRVQIARSRDQGHTWNVDTLNQERRTERLLDLAPLHGTTLDTETTTKAAYSDHYAGEPSLTADGDLFFAAFVHQAKEAHKRNRILTTRASRDQSVRQLDATVERPSSATSAPPTVKVALINKHHVKVYDAPPEELVAAVEASLEASPQAPLWASNPGAPAGAHAALTASPPLMQVELVEGEAVVSWAPANAFHTDEAVPPHPNPNPDLNYTKAIAERESLIRRTTLQASEGGRYDYADFYPPLSREGAYQVEYRPANHRFGDDQVPFDPRASSLYEGDDPDSIHLAGFERVWVYTLGIALAQLSRSQTVPGLTTPEHRARTQAMARYLCGHAVVDQANPQELKGWHFSWNTTGDSFKDPRLVTGANAWAIHGLGVFITSEAFADLPQDEEQAWFRQCYQSALLGLQRHRRTFEVGHQARQVSLMTAGWSTRGLEAVDRPFPIQGDGEPSPVEAHHERWAYYSVVDAIGYDVYDEAQPPALKACADASLCAAGEIPEDAWQSFTLSERAWSRLKRPEIARNVVTEHNLDVLSVLNHALNHTGALGLSNKGALEAWRNEVRDGIFYALWDQVPPSTLAYLAEREPHKQAWLKDDEPTDAKSPMGRIVTGGAFQEDGTFSKSSHTAIDNCSWLALSVDYRDLPPSDEGAPSIYVSRLERCLQYTILRFAKKMGFSDSGPKYYGTHYFQNAFRDPYINPSDLQESSYHLEATMGLILGLHRFVGAHPEVQSREGLEYEAKRLWANAQTFTRDHGFPYSSQRIQDLSTLLSSSTAILWFIDVHDALETPPSSFPPAALAMGQSFFGSASFLGGLETSLALGPRPEAAAYWVYGVEVIKQLGAREALKLILAEILATGVFTAITGEIHQEEINDLVDQLLVDENHNVVVVEEHVPFEVPAGYDYVGRAPPLEPSNPKDYYTSVRDMVSAYPSYWEEAFSDSIMANLGFGVGNTAEEQEEAAQALRAMVHGAIPQDVILQKTWDGIEVYRKLRLFQPLDRLYQAPRGVVLHLSPDHEGPKLIHHQPGSWTNWYEGEIAASDIPEAYKDTYIQWIHQWLLDIVLGVPSCKQRHSSDAFGVTAPSRCPTTLPGWDQWRTSSVRSFTTGNIDDRGSPGGSPGGIPGSGAPGPDDVFKWRGEEIRWVNPHPELSVEQPGDLIYASSDAIPVKQYDAVLRVTEQEKARLGSKKIQQPIDPKTELEPSHPLAELKVNEIFRSQPLGWPGGTDVAHQVQTAMAALIDQGISRRLRAYTLPSGRTAIHPDDHDVLAAMNLLQQTEVPVRLVSPPSKGVITPQDPMRKLFPLPESLPAPITFPSHKNEEVAVAVVDDFTAYDGDVRRLDSKSSQGPRHTSVILAEVQKQAPIVDVDPEPERAYAIGFDIGPPDKTTPADVVNAIRAATEERRKHLNGFGLHQVTVISLSPKLSYSIKDQFPKADREQLTRLQSEIDKRLEKVIAEAAAQDILIVSGAEPNATLSEAIVRAGAKSKHFLSTAGSTRLTPDPTASRSVVSATEVDLVAPGVAPVLTNEGVVLERDGFVPVAITAATALAGRSLSMFGDVRAIIQETKQPSRSSGDTGHLSPVDFHVLNFAQYFDFEKREKSVIEDREFYRIFKAEIKASHLFVVHHEGGPSIEEVPPSSHLHLGENDELIVYFEDRVQDVVSSRVWNQGIATGDIQVVAGSPTEIRYFGGYSLQSAGQTFRFPDHAFTHDLEFTDPDHYFVSTDPFLAHEYDSIVQHRDTTKVFLGNRRVQRLLKGQEVRPSGFPKGVSEFPIREILRGHYVPFERPSVPGGRSLKEWLTELAKTGIDVEQPVHVYVDSSARIAWPPDQALLAAMNLLGETHVPVRYLRGDYWGWLKRLDNGAGYVGHPDVYGVPDHKFQAAGRHFRQTKFVVGPSDSEKVFADGLPADGDDVNLWNLLWNTGANSSWLFAFDDLFHASVGTSHDMQYRDQKPTYYLVRFRGGVSIYAATNISTDEAAVPSIPAKDVLAAVTPGEEEDQWHWTVNAKATDPLPPVAAWSHQSDQRELISSLELTDFDSDVARGLTDSVLDEGTLISPPVAVTSKAGRIQILTGKEGAVALKAAGEEFIQVIMLQWESLSSSQKEHLTKAYFSSLGTDGVVQKPKTPKYLRAPRFDQPPTVDNWSRVRYDERLSNPDLMNPVYTMIVLISTHDENELRKRLEDGIFSRDWTTFIRALAKNPRAYSVNVVQHRDQYGFQDLSLMEDQQSENYIFLQDYFGSGAFPRMAAGWKRAFAYFPVAKQKVFALSDTGTFEPTTVPMSFAPRPPKAGRSGFWYNLGVDFTYDEPDYHPSELELYFAKIDPRHRERGPVDYIYFDLDVHKTSLPQELQIDLHGAQKSVVKRLGTKRFLENIQSGEFELWVSGRTIGQFRLPDGQLDQTKVARESTPIRIDLRKWLTP